jgi:hypothetical protein
MMLPPEYLSQKLTPYPLPTKDGGVLRTIGDARAYMVALPKNREQRARARGERRYRKGSIWKALTLHRLIVRQHWQWRP